MKTCLFIIFAIGVLGVSACRNEEKPCPAGTEMQLQAREDSLNTREQALLIREKEMANREAGITSAPATTPETVATGSQQRVAAYEGNVRTGNKTDKKEQPKTKYKNSGSSTPGQYPEASERLISEKDMQYQTAWGKKVMLNEIYARHGMIFKDAAMAQHFRKESWYKGRKASVPDHALSATERHNVAFIKARQ